MKDRIPPLADRMAALHSLRRTAREQAGLPGDHPLFREIDRLDKCWDAGTLGRVRTGLANYLAQREGGERIGDRVPPPDVFAGEIPLGYAPGLAGTRTRVNLSAKRFPLGMLIVGLIGMGKSYLLALLVKGLIATDPSARILLLDPNRTYERLCGDPSRWLNLEWESLRINALRGPAGYPYAKWLPLAFDYLASGELLHARYLLVTRALELFAAWKVPERFDAVTPVPSLFDLEKDLRERRCKPGSKEEAYRQSALHVLRGRLDTSGAVFDCNLGMEEFVTDTRVRIALDGLSPLETVRFLINAQVHYLYRRRGLDGPGGRGDLHITVIEEAAALLEGGDRGLNDFYKELFLRSRVLNSGHILITQNIESIHPVLFSGISNFFIFGLSSAEDKRIARRLLDLSPREETLLGELGRGECFARFTGYPEWPYPFIMKVDPHE